MIRNQFATKETFHGAFKSKRQEKSISLGKQMKKNVSGAVTFLMTFGFSDTPFTLHG